MVAPYNVVPELDDRVACVIVEAVAANIPARTLGDPDDFGRFAAFLCSDSARFITGAAIPVDGGADAGLQ